ncbi:MAG: hypothetical protein ABH886_09875 [Candidatus Desantisbacteria bacterium]
MKKNLFFISFVLSGFFLIHGKEGICQELKNQEMRYIPQVLFTLSYGTGSNQIGVIGDGNVEGEPGQGCGEFAVDSQENIYFTDELNGKIKKFSRDGKLILTINEMGDIRGDKEGNLFVSSGDYTTKFNSKGEIMYTVKYSTFGQKEQERNQARALAPQIPQIAEIQGVFKSPLIDTKGREYKATYTMSSSLEKAEEIKIETYSSAKESTGSFTLFSTQIKETQQKAPVIGTLSVKVNIPDYKDLKYGLCVDYVDGDGNIYANGDIEREKPLVLWEGYSLGCKRILYINYDRIVYKYDSQGNFITQIRFPDTPTYCSGGHGYVVTPAGNIYCLQFHKDGIDVVKYEWKPVPK